MKRILLSVLTFYLISFNTLADEVKSRVFSNLSEKITEYTLGIIPGEGHTEFSFDLRENNSPQYSILAVRELMKLNSGNIFTQLSASNTEGLNTDSSGNSNERTILNLGLGTRKLFNDNTLMIGVNGFYDYDLWASHERLGLGFEAKASVFDFNVNMYQKINTSGTEELVMNGLDYQLKSQIPYVHWASVFANGYEWKGIDRDDVKGRKLGGEAQLTPTLSFKAFYDDKDTSGLDDDWVGKIIFNWPPKNNNATAIAKLVSDEIWLQRNMEDHLLDKVERVNNIVVEFKGNMTISRTD